MPIQYEIGDLSHDETTINHTSRLYRIQYSIFEYVFYAKFKITRCTARIRVGSSFIELQKKNVQILNYTHD